VIYVSGVAHQCPSDGVFGFAFSHPLERNSRSEGTAPLEVRRSIVGSCDMSLDFAAPGPGGWALDRSHYPSGATPIGQWLLREGFRRGFSRVFSETGLPVESLDAAFVNGFMYTRLRPLIGADSKPRRPPPAPILKLVTRLHPLFRERNKTAIASLRDRLSNQVVLRWEEDLRPRLTATNEEFQSFEVDVANDVDLQAHITALLDQLCNNFELHFWLHGHDLGPITRYLHSCLQWGLDPTEAISALAGASPTTALPVETLCRLRALLENACRPITTLDELRTSSLEASDLLDSYLDKRGHILATGYDLDARTLIELPQIVLSSIRSAVPVPNHNPDGIAGELRNQLAQSNRQTFNVLLSDARNVMDMRYDNGPLTVEWPMGLLRRALLAAGRRLVERAAITAPEQLFEVTPVELQALFGGALPSAGELATRADTRVAHAVLDPPATIGPDEPQPPLSALPPALAEITGMLLVALKYVGLAGTADSEQFVGAGIGTERYVGIARVARSADEALDRLEPGDVLIVRAISPASNVVLALAGAVVTSDGGVLSHAAVLSRELGVPAVVGVPGALTIADGSTVEVDARAGLIRVVSPPVGA
jgi:phosphohistidine swiveling domain-containing protein